MPKEPAWKLCGRLKAKTIERIREDRKRASVQVAAMLEVIEEHLFDPDFRIGDLRRLTRLPDPNLSTRFAAELGLPPRDYIFQCRMEVAGRMLTADDHLVREIGLEVGYASNSTFGNAFTRWSGKSPKAFREESLSATSEPPPAPPELVSHDELSRACHGDLPAEEATVVLDQLEKIQNQIRGHYHDPVPSVPRSHWVEQAMAEALWQWIEVLPHEAQQAAVQSQATAFHTPAFFYRLCTESIEAGSDDIRGMQLANLALVAMHHLIERLGKQPMTLNLFARANAIAGHAVRRSGYLDQAAEYFGIATRTIGLAGDDAHPVVIMELCLYQSMLHLERDELDHAVLLARSGMEVCQALIRKLKQQVGAESETE